MRERAGTEAEATGAELGGQKREYSPVFSDLPVAAMFQNVCNMSHHDTTDR